MLTPDQVAAKWKRNLSAAGESIRAGVQNVNVSPTEKAASKKSEYLAGVQRAADSGKWERGLRSVTLQSWQDSMLKKGLPRIATGADAGAAKQLAFQTAWLPYQQQLKDKVANMPKGTPEAALDRVRVAMEHNMKFRKPN